MFSGNRMQTAGLSGMGGAVLFFIGLLFGIELGLVQSPWFAPGDNPIIIRLLRHLYLKSLLVL